jgi:hypothetical protein
MLLCSSCFGTNQAHETCLNESQDTTVCNFRTNEERRAEKKARLKEISDPIKGKLLAELKDDPIACEAFELFHDFKYEQFVDYVLENGLCMTSVNVDKFKELLIRWALTMLAREQRDRIVSFIGDDVTRKGLRHLDFSYNMLLCAILDNKRAGRIDFAFLFQRLIGGFDGIDWEGAKKYNIREFIGLIDDISFKMTFAYSPTKFWPNWFADD